MVAATPLKQRAKKFPYPSNGLVKNTAEELLRFEVMEAQAIWPSVRAFIKRCIESEQDYVIEGVHLLPQLVHQLKRTRYWKHIKLLYLVKTEPAPIQYGLQQKHSEHDWMSFVIQDAALLKKAVRMIEVKSKYVERQAKKYGFTVMHVESDFSKKIAQADGILI